MSEIHNMCGAVIGGKPDHPPLIPQRFKWLRRFGVAAALLLVAVLAIRLAWGLLAERRLNAQLALYRAEGGPVSVEEFNAELDAIPVADNAAVLYERVMDEYVGTSRSGTRLDSFLDATEMFTTEVAIADELMEANAAVLAILREAREKPSVAWAERLGETFAFRGSAKRMVARVLWFASSYHFLNGNHYEAVETLRDFERYCDAVDSHPTVISSLIAWSCHGLAFKLIERYGAELIVGTFSSDINLTPTTYEQVEQLIRELTDEQGPRHAAVRSYLGDRATDLKNIETTNMLDFVGSGATGLIAKAPAKHVLNFMMHPVLVLDWGREADYGTLAAKAASAITWQEVTSLFPDLPLSPTLMTRLTRPVTFNAMWGPSYKGTPRSVQLFFRFLARRRMAAVALAIRLHELDQGQRPSHLSALVPTYLPELPQDPFATTVVPFGYKPDAERPFLYSVGRDGKDNDGRAVRRLDGTVDRERSDIVYHLEPDSASSSTGEANDNNEDVEHEQGKEADQDDGEPEPNER